MSEDDDDVVVAEGPLFLFWKTQEHGGHALYAQWNGYTFDIYGDPEKSNWFGEAERLDDVDDWAWELLAFYERLPVAVGDHRSLEGGAKRSPRGGAG